MLHGQRDPGDDEAERADGEGDGIAHEYTPGRRDRREPPQGEEDAGLAHTPVERHKKADRDPRER